MIELSFTVLMKNVEICSLCHASFEGTCLVTSFMISFIIIPFVFFTFSWLNTITDNRKILTADDLDGFDKVNGVTL